MPIDEIIRISRDAFLFVLGVLGIVHETIFATKERPVLLILFAAMVGMTGVLRGIELDVQKRRRQDRGNGREESGSDQS